MAKKMDETFKTLGRHNKDKQFSVWLSEGDRELLDWVMDYLGTTNRSETMRSALRAFATQLKAIQRDVGRPRGS